MKTFLIFVTAVSIFLPVHAGVSSISGPDSRLKVDIENSDNGIPSYSINYDGRPVIENAPLGLIADFGDFSRGMTLAGVDSAVMDVSYQIPNIKKSNVEKKYKRLSTRWVNKDNRSLVIEFMVGDNDVAFRYLLPKEKGTGSVRVMSENSSFRFPENTVTFLTPQSDAMTGWKRTKPSYEEKYTVNAPMDTTSQYGHGYTFPALFKTPGGDWILLSETGVDSRYCGSRLSDFLDGGYKIEFPMAEENNGNGTSEPAFSLPGATPWRTITVGDSPAPIVETTVMWDLVEPRYEASREYEPGRATWSWILWQDDSINYDDQIRFIDLAAEMGYEYTLIDSWWDNNIGKKGIEELSRYAGSKNVSLLMWYSSSGWWNDIEQSPINVMCNPISRKKEMKWLKDIGVKGIKVDFFGGDKQGTMRLYEDILSDADDYGLMVIFHGCTLPRGWERMYPNYIGSEAVLASENLVFNQQSCDEEAFSATLHPFIRNAVGSMEFGGVVLNHRLNRNNDGGTTRRTSDVFQLATGVLFQSPAQNFALSPTNLTDAPAVCIDFMKGIPTRWDDVKYLAGNPGEYVLIARKKGNDWYVAGVNALDRPVKIKANLDFIAGREASMLFDGKKGAERKPIHIPANGSTPLTIHPGGGVVITTAN